MRHNPICLISFLLVLVLMVSGPMLGQETTNTGGSSGPSQQVSSRVATAPVIVDGETLFSVRGVTAFPADHRARDIADRIKSLAANPRFSENPLTLEERKGATRIMAGQERIMVVLDEDASIEQIARRSLAAVYRQRIWQAVQAYQHDRSKSALAWDALYALISTVILLVAVLAGRRLVALVRSVFERHFRARTKALEDKSLNIVKVEQVWRALTGFINLAWGVVIAVMVFAYLNYVLTLFPWTRSIGNRVIEVAIDPLKIMGLGLIQMIPNLAFLVILVFVTRAVLKVIRILFDGLASGTVKIDGFEADWSLPTYRLVRILVIALAVIVAYPYIPGSESGAFKGISLFMGIIFSLGSSSLIGNFIAGYSMTYRRAFKIGDRVKIGAHVGDVEQVRLLVTHLRTPKNEEVVVPNSTILSSDVLNYSSIALQRGLILHTTVGIGYETPWRQVEAMLLEAAGRTAGLRRDPSPFVLQTALGDFCVTYEINVYCDNPKTMQALYTELHRNILDVFNEYGIQIMTPAYESDPDQPKIVPRDQWYAAPASGPESPQAALSSGTSH